MKELTELCSKYQNHDNIVYIGDFNQDLLNNNEAIGVNYFAYDNRCTVLSTLPTRVTKTKKSCLDLVLIKSIFSYECNVILTDISDHFTPILSLKTEKKKVEPKPRVHRNLNKCTIQRIRQKLSEINWDQYDSLCHEDFTITFQNILLQTLDEHAPYVEVKDNMRKTEDWFTVGLSVSRKNKQKLLKQWLTAKKKHLGDDDNDLNCIYLKYKDY